MRKYLDITLDDRTIRTRELNGEEIVRAGRNLIARTLLECGAATVDPLSPQNPLIFSAGPFAGSSFSNANRTSVGCKSPLTGGIKEANGGGTFSYGLGQQKIAGFTLQGVSPSWVVLHFKKEGGGRPAVLMVRAPGPARRGGGHEAIAVESEEGGRAAHAAGLGLVTRTG